MVPPTRDLWYPFNKKTIGQVSRSGLVAALVKFREKR